MMNDDNQISQKTTLFGFIGEHAGSSRFCALSNKMFKPSEYNVMVIPMNIREDDFFFTLSNMKTSHVDGAIISNEYVTNVVELVDDKSELVQRSGMCDIVFREDGKLRGDVFVTGVLVEKLKDLEVKKIAMIGISAHAKAFALMACGFEVSYFYDSLEELMVFCDGMDVADADVNRIASDMDIDFSAYDVVLDFSDFVSLDMITKLAPFNLDMKNIKEYSNLKTKAHQLDVDYIGYDDMLEELTAKTYRLITQGI